MEEIKIHKLGWLKTRYTVFMYSTMINLPLCILLYWLNYRAGCWILLAFDVLTSIGMAMWMTKMEKDIGFTK